MKSGDTYRFSLLWPMETEEQVLSGEFLEKLGNKKSRFIIQLVCEYLQAHPEAMNPRETIQLIFNSPAGGYLADMVRSIIQAELAGKGGLPQHHADTDGVQNTDSDEPDIGVMFDNLDAWMNS